MKQSETVAPRSIQQPISDCAPDGVHPVDFSTVISHSTAIDITGRVCKHSGQLAGTCSELQASGPQALFKDSSL
jgi:hypothetical protein